MNTGIKENWSEEDVCDEAISLVTKYGKSQIKMWIFMY